MSKVNNLLLKNYLFHMWLRNNNLQPPDTPASNISFLNSTLCLTLCVSLSISRKITISASQTLVIRYPRPVIYSHRGFGIYDPRGIRRMKSVSPFHVIQGNVLNASIRLRVRSMRPARFRRSGALARVNTPAYNPYIYRFVRLIGICSNIQYAINLTFYRK